MIKEELFHTTNINTEYVHEVYSSMFHGMLDWIQSKFEPRFAYKVISTYDKAVQFFQSKASAKDGTVQTNILPSVTLDPNLDFVNEDRSGKFFWMFPQFNNICYRPFASKINLRDQGVTMSLYHTRYSGTCDITFWLSSIYELFDFRTKLIQYCGGIGRWIRPEFFWTHIVFPSEIVRFKRPDDHEELDWSATSLEVIQLDTTNSKEYAMPYELNAIWKLDSLSDGSTKYGADQLTEWRFVATFTWEANIPTYIRLDNYSYNDMKIQPSFHVTPSYSAQPLINNINTLSLLTHDEIISEYIKNNKIFIVNNIKHTCEGIEEIQPLAKLDDTQCQCYPETYQFWNQIVSEKLIDTDWLKKNGIPVFKYILLMYRYRPEYDEFIQNASGCICRMDDINSEFYTKIKGIRLPSIFHINDKLYKYLKQKIGTCFTIDPVCKLIYEDKLSFRYFGIDDYIKKNDYNYCNHVIDIINKFVDSSLNDKKYKQLNFGKESLVTYDTVEDLGKLERSKQFTLKNLLNSRVVSECQVFANDELVPKNCYEIRSNLLIFDKTSKYKIGDRISIKYNGLTKVLNLKLLINYIMTKTDERNYFSDNKLITLNIPEDFDTDNIKCCSYNGILNENYDFEIKGRTIIFKIEPMRDRVIQVFANRNNI